MEKKAFENRTEQSLEEADSNSVFEQSYEEHTCKELQHLLGHLDRMCSVATASGPSSEMLDYIQYVRNIASALKGQVDNLQEFHQIRKGMQKSVPSRIMFHDIVDRATGILARLGGLQGMTVSSAIAVTVPEQAIIDAELLVKIVILSGESAFSIITTKELHIMVDAEKIHGTEYAVTFRFGGSVADNHSLSQVNQDDRDHSGVCRLFNKEGNNGFSLYYARHILNLLGGSITGPDDAALGGFVLTIRIPDDELPVNRTSEFAGMHVLVVAQEGTVRHSICSRLEASGCICHYAVDAAGAVDLCSRTDSFRMSSVLLIGEKKGGIPADTLQQIKVAALLQSLPIVLFTDNQTFATAGDGSASNVSYALTLPVQYGKFIPCMREIRDRLQGISRMAGITGSVAPEETVPPVVSGNRHIRILLVEDNNVNRKLVKRLLEKIGYDCDLANDGLEAVAATENKPYDLILMDCLMPGMNGFTATETIRAREASAEQPGHVVICALTAGASGDEQEKCFKAGMDDYLKKPVNWIDLTAMITKWERTINAKNQQVQQ